MLFDLIFEFIFDLFLEGAVDASFSKKLPPVLRFILAGTVIFIYGFLIYVCLSIAINEKSWVALIIAVFITVIVILAGIRKYKEHNGGK